MLRTILFKAVMVVILMLGVGAFAAVQFNVSWGSGCSYGERFNRSTQTFGFPAPAINLHSTIDRYEPDPFQRNTRHVSVEPSGLILNVLTLGAALVFASLGLRRLFARFHRSPAVEPLRAQRTGELRRALLRRGALLTGVKKS